MSRSLWYGEPHAVALRRGADGATPALLGSAGDFCAAFFHVETCPEAGTACACLRGEGSRDECERKSVACVARLDVASTGADALPPLYVARYTNCYRGSTHDNVHAEQFALRDTALRATLDEPRAHGGTLTLFLTYQPCHHSSGHDRRHKEHGTSCTRALIEFATTVLAPRAIELDVRVPNLYRAHWSHFESQADRETYVPRARAARAGLVLLARTAHVRVGALDARDWAFLRSLCAAEVGARWAQSAAPFTSERCACREAMDAFVRAVLEHVESAAALEHPHAAAAQGHASAAAETDGPRGLTGALVDAITGEAADDTPAVLAELERRVEALALTTPALAGD